MQKLLLENDTKKLIHHFHTAFNLILKYKEPFSYHSKVWCQASPKPYFFIRKPNIPTVTNLGKVSQMQSHVIFFYMNVFVQGWYALKLNTITIRQLK